MKNNSSPAQLATGVPRVISQGIDNRIDAEFTLLFQTTKPSQFYLLYPTSESQCDNDLQCVCRDGVAV